MSPLLQIRLAASLESVQWWSALDFAPCLAYCVSDPVRVVSVGGRRSQQLVFPRVMYGQQMNTRAHTHAPINPWRCPRSIASLPPQASSSAFTSASDDQVKFNVRHKPGVNIDADAYFCFSLHSTSITTGKKIPQTIRVPKRGFFLSSQYSNTRIDLWRVTADTHNDVTSRPYSHSVLCFHFLYSQSKRPKSSEFVDLTIYYFLGNYNILRYGVFTVIQPRIKFNCEQWPSCLNTSHGLTSEPNTAVQREIQTRGNSSLSTFQNVTLENCLNQRQRRLRRWQYFEFRSWLLFQTSPIECRRTFNI